jgi:putative transposase
MKALKTKIRGLDKSQFKRLKVLTQHAKNLYNQTLLTLREAYDATGLYFSYSQMDKAMKQVKNLEGQINYRLLKSVNAQSTLKRVEQNFKSFFKAHKDFQKCPYKYTGKPKPPQFKQQSQDNFIYTYQGFQIKDGFVVLEKGLKIKLPKQLVGQTIKQIEIIPKAHSFYAVFVYQENPNQFQQVQPNAKKMAIDLGLNNLVNGVTNGVIQPFIIDGKRLKSINAYYNKRKAKMQSKLEKQQGRKWSTKLQQLTDWRYAAVNDYLHRASYQVVKTCVANNISTVVVGDITQSLDHINLGKRTNQNFVNLSEAGKSLGSAKTFARWPVYR